jgi:hypothetical protein
VHAEVAVVGERGDDGVGDGADAGLQAGAVGMRSATKPAISVVESIGGGAAPRASGWSLAPSSRHLADVDLVAAERARHLRLTSRKNGARPMKLLV